MISRTTKEEDDKEQFRVLFRLVSLFFEFTLTRPNDFFPFNSFAGSASVVEFQNHELSSEPKNVVAPK